MATGNSYTHQKTEKNNKYLLKRFDHSREYYFFHEYFTNKYLLELDQKFVAKIFKINKNKYEIYYEFFPQKKPIGFNNAIHYIDLIKSIHRKSENEGLNLSGMMKMMNSMKSLMNFPLISVHLHNAIQVKT